MDTQIILSICQIVAVTIIPIVVWVGGAKFQDRKAKKDAKLRLFLTLMANRKTTFIQKEKVDALNLIDVVFQDDKRVRNAWKSYLDSLNPLSSNFQNNNSYALDLLSEMAISLGYNELKQTEIDRFYEPQQFVNDGNLKSNLANEELRVLKASKSCGESLSEQDKDGLEQENQ